ncbi:MULTISPECIES: TonB-dependent receptor [Spongiibacter]|uniref:TonB-dependent receptor n=2 Tax=Spongiibacteraceae TaxID=1706375 RepID=UPI0023541BA5|nr:MULTISPECIES: TonB-dependent receptor [Spongiibacter]|tara:strand:+ start:429 stop:2786 length:2358 start_codon:yes stop_codon:yes gene_type:complete
MVRSKWSAALALAALPAISVAAEEGARAQLEEVIVTAQKQQQSLQDVPIAVAAVDGAKIRDAGLQRIEELTAYVPNFKMAVTGQGNAIYIRGVGSGDNRGFEQSVGMFIDGIYAGRGQQFQSPFLDIALVEVLKGPQGTLFGKNTIAGAVNISTARPSDELGGELAYQYNPEIGAREVTAIINTPLGAGFSARAAYKRLEEDGYVDNFILDRDEAQRAEDSMRLALRWDATDKLDMNLKLEKSDFGINGTTFQLTDNTGTFNLYQSNISLPISLPINLPFALLSFNLEDEIDPREDGRLDRRKSDKQFEWQPALTQNNSEAAVFTVEYALTDAVTLTSITGYSHFDFVFNLDADFTDLEFIGTENTEDFTQISQEFRIAGSVGERVDYIAGVYAHQQDLNSTLWLNLDFNALGIPSTLLGLSLPTQLATFTEFEQTTDSLAVFGQATWNITDTLSATLGLRWGEDDKEATKYLDVAQFRSKERSINPLYAIIAGALNNSENHDIANERSVDNVSPAFNIQWYATEDVMSYFRYAKGFKDGGFNASDTTASQDAFTYEDEEADTFELGVKTTLFDGAATFNAAAFYTEFANRQVSNFTLTGYVVGNAAESITQGVEADFRMALSERLTVGASMAWLDSYFTSFKDGPCTAVQTDAAFRAGNPDCRQDLSGEGTDYAPEVTASLTGQYVYPIGDVMELRLQLDLNYTDEYYTTQDRDEADVQDAFYKINSRLSLMHFKQGWEIALLGKNLTNEITTSHGNDVPLFVGAHFASTDPPRSVAVEGVLRF